MNSIDNAKTKEQIIDEMILLRQQISTLKEFGTAPHKGVDQGIGKGLQFSQTILDVSPVGILTYSSSGQCVSANEAASKIVGGTIEQLLAQNFRSIESWKRSGMLKAAENALTKMEVQELETHLITTFGKNRWFHCRFAPFHHDGILHFLLLISDVTERKSMEKTLIESEARLVQAQAIANLGSWEIDLTNQMMWGSEEAFHIYGIEYTGPESACMPLADVQKVVHPEDRPGMDDALNALLDEQKKYDQTFRIFRVNDGKLRLINSRADLLHSEEKFPLKIFGTIQDITESKRALEALRESEEKYRLLVENASEGIFIAEGGFLKFFNQVMIQMLGYSEEEIKSFPFTQLIYPEDREMVLERHVKRIEGQEIPPVYSFRFVTKNGDIRWAEIHAVVITWEGKPATLNFVSDITDRKQVEDALRDSEERYKNLVEKSFAGVYVVQDGLFVYLNDNAALFAGYKPDELIGKRSDGIIHLEDLGRTKKQVAKMLRGENVSPYEFRIVTKDGQIRWIMETISSIQYDGKKAILGNSMDITNRKQVEEKLRESEERFRALSENAPDIIYTMNLLGAITYVNPSWKRIFGHDEKDVLGHYFIDFAREEDKRIYKNLFKGIRDEEKAVNNYIGVMLTENGKERIFNMNSAFNRDSEGHIIGVVGSMKDITELRSIEKKLSQAEKMEAIGTLAGGIAHDFNNILGAILGYTQLALDASDEERQKRYLNQVMKSGERAKNLTSQILTFSRQDQQERSPIEVGGIVKEAMKLLRSLLPTTIEITQEIEPKPSIVISNAIQIHQVLMNLCTNAAHAMRDTGGVLHVCLEHIQLPSGKDPIIVDLQPGSYIRLIVRDTGHGIDPSIMDRIFDPFFTTKKVDEGTGLGLSVAYGIVKSHGGTINVQSTLGRSSTFSVYLPRIEDAEEKKIEAPQPILGGSERILFVDDEPYLAEIGKEGLTKLGYEVTVRTSSIEALQAFRTCPERFDLVITDMTMPNMTGIQLAAEILKIRHDIPIILCTGYSEIIDEEKSNKYGIRAFLMKPISLEEIARTIRKVLVV
ncbi:MAG: PAS domain S-box protein [Syntrophaceae bacterium]